jgi:hypothetical protein
MENSAYYQDLNAIGSERFYRLNPLTPWAIATDGAFLMFQKLECFWLFDLIVLQITKVKQKHPDIFSQGFLVSRFVRKNNGDSAVLTMDDGNKNILISQTIPFTTLTENVLLFVEYNGEGWTILLPSEH